MSIARHTIALLPLAADKPQRVAASGRLDARRIVALRDRSLRPETR